MADDTSTTTEPDEAATANPGDTPDEELGEAALRALQREREQRRALEQQLRELQPLAAKARELEEAQKTEAQRLQERAAAAERHVTLGASLVREHPWWTVLTDPAGMAYCLTDRHPVTGRRPDR